MGRGVPLRRPTDENQPDCITTTHVYRWTSRKPSMHCLNHVMGGPSEGDTSRGLRFGLVDMNMPMLYGEGKKVFCRFQLDIVRASNGQSIIVWGSWHMLEVFQWNRQSWLLAGSHDTCGHRPRATQNIFNGFCDGPSNDDFKSLLTLFSTRLTKSVAKPLARRRNESAGSVSEEWSRDELQVCAEESSSLSSHDMHGGQTYIL
ncbi:hypothetical protein SCLCIDRAFT_1066764 [Scleroderma citrinum Foug A]|uniref:Uncharacterized protein n=1 Tax=Scleroderma citrinum Foug A TaxID=1036808 RepID=A0A0C3EIJ1_9AGAM|nr:hypothetical protein SCLCIDRAFT_1066764 [Scleroderma citrinum Foug A]